MRPTGPLPALLLFMMAAIPTGAAGSAAPQDTLEVYPVHGTPAEVAVVGELQLLLSGLDLRDWVQTPVVRIDETQIPHSHPVLTLHTRHRGNPDDLLAVFLHEQFHWWVMDRDEALDAAVAELREIYPEVPVGGPTGARNESSSYLHLVVCHLELQAMEALKGPEIARATLAKNNHYTWIYDQVLNDPRVGEVLTRHGLVAR